MAQPCLMLLTLQKAELTTNVFIKPEHFQNFLRQLNVLLQTPTNAYQM